MKAKRKTQPKRFTGSSKKKSYGIGGAVMTLGKNLLQGKKFGKGMFEGVGKTLINPNPLSTVTAAGGALGALAGKSKNPAIQKLGKTVGNVANVAGMFTGGGGGGAGFQNILQTLGKGAGGGGMQNVLGSLIGSRTAADGMKVYASGGSIPRMKVLKSYHEGGEIPPHEHPHGGLPGDPTKRPATRLEIAGGLASDDGRGATWADRGFTTDLTQKTGSTIETDPDKIAQGNQADADAGTIFSFNTDPISADMPQEQFDLAMQSRFVAEQFKGRDIQNPQQLADAYKDFTHKATLAIRENEPEVANAAREFAKTNDNFKIKMDALGENPTDAQIAKMMVDMNTDGLLGDLHGAVVNRFMPKNQINAYKISDGDGVAGNRNQLVNEFTVEGQRVKKGGQIYTSFNDAGINDNEGMRKYFREATEAGVDLTKGNLDTEEFMEDWFKNPENAKYIFLGKNIRDAAIGRGGDGSNEPDQGVAGLGNLMIEGQENEMVNINKLANARTDANNAKNALEGQIQRLIGDVSRRDRRSERAIELREEIDVLREQLDGWDNKAWIQENRPDVNLYLSQHGYDKETGDFNIKNEFGGKVKVLKAGGKIGALSGLFR